MEASRLHKKRQNFQTKQEITKHATKIAKTNRISEQSGQWAWPMKLGKGGGEGAAAMMTGKLMMRQLQRGEHCHQARQLESDKQARGHEEKKERER